MKGVLFSADFVEDNDGNYRLLEVNTDTGFISSSIDTMFDFSPLKQVIADNNLTTVEVIHKSFQDVFVDRLETELDGTDVTTFTKHQQNINSIYPTQIADASEKFIIRLAYDEGALFDTEYCKERINVLTLFADASETGSIPGFYYSGSSQTYNTLVQEELNDHSVLPDFAQKRTWEEYGLNVRFVKGGSAVSSSEDRVTDAVTNYLDFDNYYAEKFYYNNTQVTNSNRVESIRAFYVAYWDTLGSSDNISLCKVGDYKIQSVTEIPNSVSNDNLGYNLYDAKHYYEFGTNWPNVGDMNGFKGDENVYNEDSTLKLISNVLPNDRIKSFFISGSPTTDNVEEFESWRGAGDTLPTPFYVTSSIVETMLSQSIGSGIIGELKLSDEESLYSGLKQHYLVHESSSNQFRFLALADIDKDDHSVVDHSGSKHDIVDTNILLIEEQDMDLYNPDVEEQDTFIVSASVPLVVHNAPCFIAGTKVHIEEKGITNIEDVEVGDKVISYNHDTDVVEYKEVYKVRVEEDKQVVKYLFENGTELTGTPDHPLFVVGKGYSSYYPKQTKEDSGLDVEQILLGDEVLHMDGYGVTISDIIEQEETHTVYNLEEVNDNHNFFVEDLLAHNRFCCFRGTTNIQMMDGEQKPIKDVEIGDWVYSFHTDYNETIHGEVIELHNTTKLSDHVKRNESVGQEGMGYFYLNGDKTILFTPEHPWLTKDGWKAISPDSDQEPFKSEQESKTLEVGDMIYSPDDGFIEVFQIDFLSVEEDEVVYNFTVKDTHTYLVGGFVVHNK